MRRWVQYDMPVFVLVECDGDDAAGQVHAVVLAEEPGDLYPARSTGGSFRVYDEDLRRLDDHPDTQTLALAVAERRDAWPQRETWGRVTVAE